MAAQEFGRTTDNDLCFTPATELAAMIRTKQVSAREVMAAHLEQIRRVNPTVNAIVARLDDDACLALARAADDRLARGEAVGPLHGLPIAFKDLQPAVGFPCTRGSTIYRNAMPTEDSVLVARLRAAGALPIGKTNTPEFGMGSHTFNKVYGVTRNPYNPAKTAGGSSGGAGAALASGMLPIADGTDMGGSLRNPGNFNNVVGMRPTLGLVPNAPNTMPFLGFSTGGALARRVQDVALMMSVLVGEDAADPASVPFDPAIFTRPLARSFGGVRVAWCPDLGTLPLDPSVRAVLSAQRKTLEDLGCIVEDAAPDLSGAETVFMTIRAFRTGKVYGPLLPHHRNEMKPEAVAEVEQGLALTSTQVSEAMAMHGELLDRMRGFQERYEFIACAVNQIPPFDATLDWPKAIDGVPMEHYIAWMRSAYWITPTLRPAISVPAGFTADGLPVGIQLVGRYRADFSVLQLAHAFESATGFGRRRPSIG